MPNSMLRIAPPTATPLSTSDQLFGLVMLLGPVPWSISSSKSTIRYCTDWLTWPLLASRSPEASVMSVTIWSTFSPVFFSCHSRK